MEKEVKKPVKKSRKPKKIEEIEDIKPKFHNKVLITKEEEVEINGKKYIKVHLANNTTTIL